MKKLIWEYDKNKKWHYSLHFIIKKGLGKLYELKYWKDRKPIGHFTKLPKAKACAQLIHNG